MTLKTLNDNLNCIDVTNEWLKDAKPNTHEVLDSYYYISNDKIYIVDGSKNVVLDYSLKELEIANWIENTFGGEIYMNPRVNFPKNVKTADYWWNGEYWDLKIPHGNSKRTIENLLKNCKRQSRNFILDVSDNNLSIFEIERQVEKIYKSKGREWIKNIIIIKNHYLKIYNRKKD